jgi:outer membrane protein
MKKSFWIIQTFILAAILVLYVLFFVNLKNSKNAELIPTPAKVKIDSAMQASPFRIAFINTDTILENYKYYKVLEKDLASQQTSLEVQLQTRYKELEQEYKKLESKLKLGLISQEEAAQKDLKMREDFEDYRSRLREGYLEKEQKMTAQLYDSIISYVNRFNRDAGYSYILAYAKGGGILHADKAFDLTTEVLKGLNEEYDTRTGDKKKK